MPHTADLDLIARQISELASADAVAGFLNRLGYDTGKRTILTPEAIGLAGDSASALKRIELLSEDSEQFLRVIFAQPKSLTAKVRNDLARVLGKSTVDHLLVLASDFDTLEFVLLDKRKRESKGPVPIDRIQVVPKVIHVDRRSPSRLDLQILRRLTWTSRDALAQFDKLRSAFECAAYAGEYFQNRGLFADYFLRERLREDAAWRDNPSEMFAFVRDLLREASSRWGGQGKDNLRKELFEPVFQRLGFKATVNRPSKSDQTQPDYLLKDVSGTAITAAFVYPWDRWLDGPDLNDPDTPEENPGACVVTALNEGSADWIVVTNGRHWRLYGRQAHARATNFYEVDLIEALTASGDTDPNEAFRYWWLFFRPRAFQREGEPHASWLDMILLGSREYAKRLGDRLKDRIFEGIFRHMARGFIEDRQRRLRKGQKPTEGELDDIFEATLALLYRLLFLLYAESRDLLPIREAPYFAASLKKIKEEISEKAGVAESDVPERLQKAYSAKETALYDRLSRLFQAMDKGDPVLNVPTYNGGLFNTSPDNSDDRDTQIARFLLEHKVPDRHLALAIDRLSRDQDERTLGLVFIDYKSLEVRHLGSIYEGLLEFTLKIAPEDLATQADKKGERYISLSEAKPKRGKQAAIVVQTGDVYLSNDNAERKASGSYYTPDPIVEYIVANTVGPVLEKKLEALRSDFRKVRKTFNNELEKSQAYPSADVRSGKLDHRQWAGLQTYNHHKDLVERLFDLKVLDPAMGSGHFLVEAVDFVTDRLLNFLNAFPTNPVNFALDRTRQSILESLGEQGVTVDPNKLTDINLLKRHVLKRCIYGVDLNPMAVELAKVSLWLDAFTLGAPLSFLDHHLRCGNSLIGATFEDLKEALAPAAASPTGVKFQKGMFGIDYEPLLRAIRHVLFISKMADATSAEVKKSASEYEQARKDLSGYQVVLDLLVAKYFGVPDAPEVLTHGGTELDLSSRGSFLECVTNAKDRKLVELVAELARKPGLRFFHWEIEFPEVFFGFVDADERQIQPKDQILHGSAGFDCVVGNPPYVRRELVRTKPVFKASFSAFDSNADLYVYFIEQDYKLLNHRGRTGIIVSNKFLRAKYAPILRGLLAGASTLFFIHDFRSLRVFEDASTYPCIFVFGKGRPESDHSLTVTTIPELRWKTLDADLVRNSRRVPQERFSASEWIFPGSLADDLIERLNSQSVELMRFCGDAIRKGIETGCNSAFLVDECTRNLICDADPRSERLIIPVLRGRDAKRYMTTPSDYILLTNDLKDLDTVPGIRDHLLRFRKQLEQRTESAVWFKHRRSHSHLNELQSDKIVFPNIGERMAFSMCPGTILPLNKVYYIANSSFPLLGVLNSQMMTFVAHQYMPHLRGDYLSMEAENIGRLPIHRAMASPKAIRAELRTAFVEWFAGERPQEDEALIHRLRDEDKETLAGAIGWIAEWITSRTESSDKDMIRSASRLIDQLVMCLYDLDATIAAGIQEEMQRWPASNSW